MGDTAKNNTINSEDEQENDISKRELLRFKKLMHEDFARSGLSRNDLKKAQCEIINPDKALELFRWPYWCYSLPFIDPLTNEINLIRGRFLVDLEDEDGKLIRYTQPAGSPPHIYFPATYSIKEWTHILNDVNTPIIFTEGEKKAIATCKQGLVCIALPGVWSFKSKKQQKNLIDDFKLINLNNREIELCFDSDFRSNQDVMKALRSFAKELTRKGAIVGFRWLPDNMSDKVGLDDCFAAGMTADDYNDLPFELYDFCKKLIDMNEELAYITDLNVVVGVKSNVFYSTKQKLEFAFGPLKMTNTDDKEVKVVAIWNEWEQRRAHKNIVYEPVKIYNEFSYPLITNDNEMNAWKGWGVKPIKGDITPLMDLLENMFKDNPEGLDFFMQWLAYPLQNPGAKLNVAVLIQSILQGVGKSFIGLIMGDIYGSNFGVVEESDLEKDFNAWSINKQFILGDEITGAEYDKRKTADRIKSLITREKIIVNQKYQPVFTIQDCINYIMTSNHPDALYLENRDRRWFIHSFDHRPPQVIFRRLDKWRKLNDKKGPSALFHHLLYNVDCKKFDPLAAAPMTSAKTAMQDVSLSDLDDFANRIYNFPESMLQYKDVFIDRDLFTLENIIQIHDRGALKNTSKMAMRKALKRAGFFSTEPTKIKNKTHRLWALNHIEKWRNADHNMRKDHYEKSIIGVWPKITASKGKEKKY